MTVAAQTVTEVVTLRHQYNSEIGRVFAAWSNPEALGQWFGPHSHNSIVEGYEFNEGGVFKIRMVPTGRSSDCAGEAEADSVCAGTFVKIDAPNSIVMTFDWIEGGAQMGETLLSIEFTAVGGGTEITLTHEKIPSEELRQAHAGGWLGTLECLEEYLR